MAQRLKGHGEMERIWNWIQENSRDGKLWWAEFHAESMNPHKLVELSDDLVVCLYCMFLSPCSEPFQGVVS